MARTKDDFYELYRSSVASLQTYLRRLGVIRVEVVADLVQETYLEAYRSWASLKSDTAAQAWLYTIARRQLAKSIRKNRQHLLCELEDAALSPFASLPPSQENELDAQAYCQTILRHLADTPQELKRQALVAYYLEEKSFREIAEETGVNLSTLTTWCSRFRQDCLKKLAKGTPDERSPHVEGLPSLKKGQTYGL